MHYRNRIIPLSMKLEAPILRRATFHAAVGIRRDLQYNEKTLFRPHCIGAILWLASTTTIYMWA